jgi:phage terminase large subunit-like protein
MGMNYATSGAKTGQRKTPTGEHALPLIVPSYFNKSGPKRIIQWIEYYCITPKGVGAKTNFDLRPFQKKIIRGAFNKKVRQALVSVPRANGKSSLAAALAVQNLIDGPESAEVVIVASTKEQAGIVFRAAKRMIELNPLLENRVQIYRDKIFHPATNGALFSLPADPDALHGYDPSLLIVDELHVVTHETWEAATTAAGKRPESLTLAISTPSNSHDSIMWELVQHGRKGTDKQFFFTEWAAPEGCRIDDEAAWKTANPALACRKPFLKADAMRAVMKTVREEPFRQLRLGQWVGKVNKWLPFESWDFCQDTTISIGPDKPITAFFDGSVSGDSTAIIGCTVTKDGVPHIFPIGIWEKPEDAEKSWRVPRKEVNDTVDFMFTAYNVLELACDPPHWRTEIEQWADKHGKTKVIEFPTNQVSRMAPAVDRFYALVMEKKITHNGDERVTRHLNNCAVSRTTVYGDMLGKDRRNSTNKIDAGIGAIGALQRASHYANKPRKRAVAGSSRR